MMEVMVQEGIVTQGEFHNRLFEDYHPDYSIRDVEVVASVVGADADEVVKAGKERRRSYAIKWGIEDGKKFGVEGPLGLTVNGTPVEENTAEAIERAIERNL